MIPVPRPTLAAGIEHRRRLHDAVAAAAQAHLDHTATCPVCQDIELCLEREKLMDAWCAASDALAAARQRFTPESP